MNYLRVRSDGCSTDCGSAAQYHVRFHDTTIAVPRFNNAGALLGSSTFSLPAKAALVLNTATVPGVAGQGGTVTVAHDGGYGGLAVKSVALEPATGFSFDSLGVYKPL